MAEWLTGVLVIYVFSWGACLGIVIGITLTFRFIRWCHAGPFQ